MHIVASWNKPRQQVDEKVKAGHLSQVIGAGQIKIRING